jgi:hypothetical protein
MAEALCRHKGTKKTSTLMMEAVCSSETWVSTYLCRLIDKTSSICFHFIHFVQRSYKKLQRWNLRPAVASRDSAAELRLSLNSRYQRAGVKILSVELNLINGPHVAMTTATSAGKAGPCLSEATQVNTETQSCSLLLAESLSPGRSGFDPDTVQKYGTGGIHE